MAETFANLADLAKEVWTQDRLEKQFYNKRLWLDRITKTNKYTIGRKAMVPMETSLPGGSSSRGASGVHALNAADALHTDVAEYTLVQLDQQIEVDFGTVAQSVGPGIHSAIDGMDQNIASNLDALRVEANRQTLGNGDAVIAQCAAGAADATVLLDPAGYGYDAIVRGWLRPGLKVDIGTAANPVLKGTVDILTVNESPTAPSFTASASVTEAGTDFVSVAGNRTAVPAVHETSGLRTIAGSATSTIGTIAGGGFWQPAEVDTTTTIPTLDLILRLQRKVRQKTGKWPTFVTTSLKQQADLYSQYESQVRFARDDKTAAGNVEGFTWNGTEVTADPDIPDRELYLLTLEDFLCVTGARFSKPTWVSEMQGNTRGFGWRQGFTSFVDAVAYFMQVGVKRRNSNAAALGLTG